MELFREFLCRTPQIYYYGILIYLSNNYFSTNKTTGGIFHLHTKTGVLVTY